jgi:hypothetical protein
MPSQPDVDVSTWYEQFPVLSIVDLDADEPPRPEREQEIGDRRVCGAVNRVEINDCRIAKRHLAPEEVDTILKRDGHNLYGEAYDEMMVETDPFSRVVPTHVVSRNKAG